jgi:hypothetical protein
LQGGEGRDVRDPLRQPVPGDAAQGRGRDRHAGRGGHPGHTEGVRAGQVRQEGRHDQLFRRRQM